MIDSLSLLSGSLDPLFLFMYAIHFVILGLAVWRISRLLSSERGPFAISEKIRHLCGVRYTDRVITDSELSKLISCPACTSVWLGAIASVLYITLGIAIVWIALPFALSAFAIIVGSLVDKQ